MAYVARKFVMSRICLQQLSRFMATSSEIGVLMEKFKPLITEKLVHETGVSCVLKLTDTEYTLDLRDAGTILEGAADDADISLGMNNETFMQLIDGSTTTAAAYMSGQLKLEGNIMQAMRLSGVFKTMQGVISETANE